MVTGCCIFQEALVLNLSPNGHPAGKALLHRAVAEPKPVPGPFQAWQASPRARARARRRGQLALEFGRTPRPSSVPDSAVGRHHVWLSARPGGREGGTRAERAACTGSPLRDKTRIPPSMFQFGSERGAPRRGHVTLLRRTTTKGGREGPGVVAPLSRWEWVHRIARAAPESNAAARARARARFGCF
jgi:hypothetical protein